jgi:hypothetical protein
VIATLLTEVSLVVLVALIRKYGPALIDALLRRLPHPHLPEEG